MEKLIAIDRFLVKTNDTAWTAVASLEACSVRQAANGEMYYDWIFRMGVVIIFVGPP